MLVNGLKSDKISQADVTQGGAHAKEERQDSSLRTPLENKGPQQFRETRSRTVISLTPKERQQQSTGPGAALSGKPQV